jgi:hypothetical protein
MTLLLDLPPETFGQVIAYYIHTIELPEAFRARTVCHAFAGAINDELLAEDAAKIMDYGEAGSSEYGWEGRLPIAREDRCRLSDADIDGADKTSTIFLRNNAIALLTNSVQRGVQTSIPIFINEVADDLMRFAPEATRAKIPPNHTQRNTSSLQHTEFYVTRNRYVDSLCVAFAMTNRQTLSLLLGKDKHEPIKVSDYRVKFDYAAAIPTIGDFSTIKHYFVQQVQHQDSDCLILAVACTGKTEALDFLLGLSDQDSNSVRWSQKTLDGSFPWKETLALLTDFINITAKVPEVVAPALVLEKTLTALLSFYSAPLSTS